MKLLLVEDNPADARLFRELLKASPIRRVSCQQATRLDCALEWLRQENFDVILLDLGLPDSDGMDTLQSTQAKNRAVPIVVLTGLDDERFALEAVRAGAQDYLVKGHFDGELLSRTIRYAVERKRSEEEVRQLNADLERRVAQRTAELQIANERLLQEIGERRKTADALEEAQAKLSAHAENLERIVASRTAKLHETITELDHFSYAIVHDLRAPLRAMQGFAELIEQECGGCTRPLSQEYIRRIKVASRRMDQLIIDCLNYSKITRQELPLEPVNVFFLIAELLQTYPNLHASGADIQLDPGVPVVLGNQAALTQCFSNLLDNAIKFAKPQTRPKIRIWSETIREGVSPVRPFVRIWVEDEGIGISDGAQERIFGIFERATTDHPGTGIGLAVVRKVVERMGGRVGVESRLDEGSRFWVQLPAA